MILALAILSAALATNATEATGWRSVLISSVDLRLRRNAAFDASTLSRFTGYPQGAERDVFNLNTNFWARGVDFSCASPWNGGTGRLRAGTAISPRHIVFAKHFPLGKDTRVVFVDGEGNVCACYVEKLKAFEKSDIMIASLNAELPPSFHPAKILPEDYERHIGPLEGLPVVTLSQHEKALVSDMRELRTDSRRAFISFWKPKDELRLKYREWIVGGDSGSPVFLLAGDEPILLFCHAVATGGDGLHCYRREIQAAMDELCPGYRIETFDFSQKQ